MTSDTQTVLTGASGIFSSILGLATGNTAAFSGGLSALFSILSPTQRSTIQAGSAAANQANSQYQAALNNLTYQANSPSTVPSWLLFVLGGGLLYFLFKKKRR